MNVPSYSDSVGSLQHAVGMFVAAGLGNHRHVNEPVCLLTWGLLELQGINYFSSTTTNQSPNWDTPGKTL